MRVNDSGTGSIPIDRRRVHNGDLDAELGERDGCDESGRPCTDNQDLDLRWKSHFEYILSPAHSVLFYTELRQRVLVIRPMKAGSLGITS